jgi:hypothetical protein
MDFGSPWSAVPWHRFGQSAGKPAPSKEALNYLTNTHLAKRN